MGTPTTGVSAGRVVTPSPVNPLARGEPGVDLVWLQSRASILPSVVRHPTHTRALSLPAAAYERRRCEPLDLVRGRTVISLLRIGRSDKGFWHGAKESMPLERYTTLTLPRRTCSPPCAHHMIVAQYCPWDDADGASRRWQRQFGHRGRAVCEQFEPWTKRRDTVYLPH